MIRGLSLAVAATVVVAGCDAVKTPGRGADEAAPASPEAAPATPPEPVVEAQAADPSKSEIDWDAARADFDAREDRADEGGFQVAQAGPQPEVPILLPTGIVTAQSTEGQPTIRQLPDGYFASYPGADYDIVVNGTNIAPDYDGGERPVGDEMAFTATAAGAQVSLSRYGADYLVEFECNTLDLETSTCITEDEAMEVAESLIVAGTRR